jgi:hypothetical protein
MHEIIQNGVLGFLKRNPKLVLIISFLLISTVAASQVMTNNSNPITTIKFVDVNNAKAGMTLNTLNHEFVINNPSGEVSTGTYKEESTCYVINYDGGFSSNVPKYKDGVLGPNGEKWKRA